MKIKIAILSISLFFIPKYSISQNIENVKRIYFGFNFGYASQNLSGVNRYIEALKEDNNSSTNSINGGLQYSLYTDYKFFKSPFLLVGAELSYSDNSTNVNRILFHNDGIHFTTKVQLQTLATYLNLSYGYSLSDKIDLSLKSGLGYYQCKFILQNESSNIQSLNAKETDKASTFGFHIGVNLNYKIIDIIVLNSNLSFNSAKIDRIKDSQGNDIWVFDLKDGTRKLEINLSGFQFQIGVGINI